MSTPEFQLDRETVTSSRDLLCEEAKHWRGELGDGEFGNILFEIVVKTKGLPFRRVGDSLNTEPDYDDPRVKIARHQLFTTYKDIIDQQCSDCF